MAKILVVDFLAYKGDPYLPLKRNSHLGRALFKPQSGPQRHLLELSTKNRVSASNNNEISRNMADGSTRNGSMTRQP